MLCGFSICRCTMPTRLTARLLPQALAEDIAVVTSDEVFRRYAGIKVIW
jgi:hypothetical protein